MANQDRSTIGTRPAAGSRSARVRAVGPGGPGAWRVSVMLSALAAFAIASGAVYLLGLKHAEAPPAPPATARLRIRPAAEGAAGDPRPDLDPRAVREALESDASLRQALQAMRDGHAQPEAAQLAAVAEASADRLAQLRKELEIAIEPSDPPRGLDVAITAQGDHAALLVNCLALDFAARKRSAWKREREEARRLAQTQVETARQRMTAAREALDRFLAEHFRRLQQRSEELDGWTEVLGAAAPSRAASPYAPPAAVPVRVVQTAPQRAQNPAWVELDQQVRAARQRLKELVEHRTAAHPEVRDAESRLRDLEARLASVPELVEAPGPTPGDAQALPPPPDRTRISPLPPDAEPHSDALEGLAAPGPPAGTAVVSDDPRIGALAPSGPEAAVRREALEAVIRETSAAATRYRALDARWLEAFDAYQGALAHLPSQSGGESAWPGIDLALASAPAPEGRSAGPVRSGLPRAAVAAGIAAALSMLLWARGARAPATYADVAALQADLPIPVVGRFVSSGQRQEHGGGARAPRSLLGTLFSLAGVALVTLGLGAAALLALGFRPNW